MTTSTTRAANAPPQYDLLFDFLRANERFPRRYAAPDFAAFRVVGVHLPNKHEPPTISERKNALTWYSAQIFETRWMLAEAERDFRFEWARRCKLRLIELTREKGIWIDARRYVLSDTALNGSRPFSQFATSRGTKA